MKSEVDVRYQYRSIKIHIMPGELKGGGHVTITHWTLASIIRVFCIMILPRSDTR